ncbi:hypothetical protein [Rugamonas rubra]|uniref:Lipoprotein n=1 Tax=Rugamonas rubra TaxID=758825 RepID=A0A1I4R9P3_9BURK|nr:hypothetical protein [Rugamonas rubra]SFM48726.1 hypothetical protein SAMN02982985_04259 [Rugamonas rubra]
MNTYVELCRSTRKLAGACAVIALFTMLTGCAAFYSETRDKQGQAAKGAWEKVDVGTQIKLARKNHAALLADQLKATDELALANRALAARRLAISAGSVQELLLAPVQDSLRDLVLKPAEATAWLAYQDSKANADRELALVVQNFKLNGMTPKSCADLEDNDVLIADIKRANPDKGARLTPIQFSYRIKCMALKKLGAPPAYSDGLLADAYRARDQAKTLIYKADQDTRPERDEFAAALKAYQDATSLQEANAKGLGEKLQAARQKLENSIDQANKAGKALDSALGTTLLAESEQSAIMQFLATFAASEPAVGSGTEAPAAKGTTSASQASLRGEQLAVLSEFAAQAKSKWADADAPNLVPLLLAKNLAKARSDAAVREIALRNLELALCQSRVDVQTERYQRLRKAYELLAGQPAEIHNGTVIRKATATVALGESVSAAFTPVGARPAKPGEADAWNTLVLNKQRTWEAAAYYLDDLGRLQPAALKPQYQIDALAHDRSLSLAESSLTLWTTTINSVVGQSASAAALGIKPSDIKDFANSAILLWIGKGVN